MEERNRTTNILLIILLVAILGVIGLHALNVIYFESLQKWISFRGSLKQKQCISIVVEVIGDSRDKKEDT